MFIWKISTKVINIWLTAKLSTLLTLTANLSTVLFTPRRPQSYPSCWLWLQTYPRFYSRPVDREVIHAAAANGKAICEQIFIVPRWFLIPHFVVICPALVACPAFYSASSLSCLDLLLHCCPALTPLPRVALLSRVGTVLCCSPNLLLLYCVQRWTVLLDYSRVRYGSVCKKMKKKIFFLLTEIRMYI